MRRFFTPLVVLVFAASSLGAQTPVITTEEYGQTVIAGDGWEAFPYVEYQGGDARFAKKKWGMLVMTDSTIGFYECTFHQCAPHKKKNMAKDPALWLVPLKAITEVSSSTQVRGASTTGKIAFGLLANDRTEEFFGFVHETASSAEAPIFKAQKTQGSALEAKLKFRLKKAGITLATP